MRSKLDCQRGLSKYLGVRPREGARWQAQFRLGEVELRGSYFVEDQAARAYDGFALFVGGRCWGSQPLCVLQCKQRIRRLHALLRGRQHAIKS